MIGTRKRTRSSTTGQESKNKRRKVESSSEEPVPLKTEIPDVDLPSTGTTLQNGGRSGAKPDVSAKQMSAAVEVKAESTEDSSSDTDQLNDFEQRRQKNLEDNAAFLMQIGVFEAKQNLSNYQDANKPKPTSRGLKERREKEVLPARPRSLRLQRIDPSGSPLPDPPPKPVEWQEEEHPRKPSGPLPMNEHLSNVNESDIGDEFITSLKALGRKGKKTMEVKMETDGYLNCLNKMTINAERVAKLVPNRIFSVAIHPSSERVLACAGGKWGRLALWDVESKVGQDGVFCFAPHSRPVNCIQFHKQDSRKMYSCSYDGTLRCAEFEQGIFDEVYATPEDDDIRLSCFDFLSNDSIVASQSDGMVAVTDIRTDSTKAEHLYLAHYRNVKSVHVHPTQPQYFATASTDGNVMIWDLRKMSAKKQNPVATLPHSKSIDSAYFSPITGNALLTTSMNDKISIWDTRQMNSDIRRQNQCRHDNHTGRWLSNFRATWHPQREDVFVVGSMARPRQIEIFDNKLNLIKKFRNEDYLVSVCSLNAFHPTRNILVGGNSSGRMFVFMD